MKRFAVLSALLFLLTACAGAVGEVQGEESTAHIDAPSGILVEAGTGEILFEKDAHTHLPPASVTKIMTMLLIVEALDDGRITLDDTVTVSEHAASMGGSQVYLAPNERMSVHEMLKSIAVASANDACVAMAEHLCGSEEAFVGAMNAKAEELGMTDTHFDNCCGLDSDTHYTSAYDIALMSRALLAHERIRSYTTIWMDTIRDGQFGLTNTNKLVRFYDGATGLKTGFTSKALYCVSASAVRGGMELIAVVMHADSSAHRNADASGLLNYGFANYALVRMDGADAPADIPVKLGKEKSCVCALSPDDALLVRRRDAGKIEKELSLVSSLTAPVEKGQKVGEVRYSMDGKILKTVPVLARFAVEKRTLGEIFEDTVQKLLMK